MSRFYFTNLASDVSGYKLLLVDQRDPTSTALSTSVTATTSGGFSIQCTDTSGGTALKWITKPFLSDVAFAADKILFNLWLKESAAGANAGVCPALYEYTTSEQATFAGTTNGGTEAGTSAARYVFLTTNLTATTIDAGNRLVVKLFVENVGTMGASETVTVDYGGISEGIDGDSFIELNEAVRCNERQLLSGTYPTLRGLGQSYYDRVVDHVNTLTSAGFINTNATVQMLKDECAFERDNL